MPEATPLREILATSDSLVDLSDLTGDAEARVSERAVLIARDVVAAGGDPDKLAILSELLGPSRALNPARANLLRSFDIAKSARVLEVGCGWGTLTAHLSDRAAIVDAIDPDPSRAWVARERTRAAGNVRVAVGVVTELPRAPTYDVVVIADVDILGWSGGDNTRLDGDVAAILSLLNDGGSIIIALENSLGVKYLAGGTRRGDDSAEGEPPARPVSPPQIAAALERAARSVRAFAVFPDVWSPRVVMDTSALLEHAPSLVTALPEFPSPDGQNAVPRATDEKATWAAWVG